MTSHHAPIQASSRTGATRMTRRALVVLSSMLAIIPAKAQEVRGYAKRYDRGDAVWGAAVVLIDSLGREAATTKTNRRGEFVVRAPLPGTYWLELSERSVGSMSSPVFVLDSGITMQYEHIFQVSVRDRVAGNDFSAQALLPARFSDSTSGKVYRGMGASRVPQVTVSVLDARNESPMPNTELALVPIDSRNSPVIAGKSDSAGVSTWRGVQPTWYRVISRRLGFLPAGTRSFPIVGDADSITVVLRLSPVTLLDPVTVMENQINAYGFNLNLMRRNFLGGDELRERNPSARNIDELITSINIPGLAIRTGQIRSVLSYRGVKVRVFILDGSRTSGELPEIEPSSIESLLFVPPSEAGAIFGPDAIGGALIVNTRKR
jgi:hypothetical protein